MRTIIAGGRDVPASIAEGLVKASIEASGWANQITQVIHGDALGIDRAAGRVCEGTYRVRAVPADWSLGKAAGPIRNRKMAEMADALIAIWDGKSRGTKNMIETAERRGLKVFIHRIESDA